MSSLRSGSVRQMTSEMSKISSRIPVPKSSSKIPVRMSSAKKTVQKCLIRDSKPKMKEAVIIPVVTKKSGIPFKEFNLTKAGTKPVVKRKSIGMMSKKPKPALRQTKLSESISNRKTKVKTTGSLKRELSPNIGNRNNRWDLKSMIRNDDETLKQMQAELNAEFEPNEFFRNQILSNKELTPGQLAFCSPLKDKKNSRDPAEIALERIQRWSAYKKSKASLAKENLFPESLALKPDCSSEKNDADKAVTETFTRRCTWAAGSPCKPKLDAYEEAMSRIKRMTISRAQSPLAEKSKCENSMIQSPMKQPSAYENAMQLLHSMNSTKKPKMTSEVKKPADEESEPANTSPTAEFLKMSPGNVFKTRPVSLYRPLQNFRINSPSKHIQKRLTDISEHSENENTNPLSQHLSGISSKYSRSSVYESSSSDVTPQLPGERTSLPFSFLSLKRPLMKPFTEESSHILQSTPVGAAPESVSSKTSPELHNPIPVSLYSSKPISSSPGLFDEEIASTIDASSAPICTPLALKRIAKNLRAKAEDEPDPVKQSLNFLENDPCSSPFQKKDKFLWQPRYSNYVKHIPTKAKQEEALADEECACFMTKQSSAFSQCRTAIMNPVAQILSKGDRMHFVPIENEVAA